ncbi:MAG: (2Fe-2S)-binding protein [Chromatiales bacterium]|nr:(2Fe-2S)-binding protein [Chromatiales bacterium]
MYVCICNKVTDKEIHTAVSNGTRCLDELCGELNVGSCCGRCRECAREVLHQAVANHSPNDLQAIGA